MQRPAETNTDGQHILELPSRYRVAAGVSLLKIVDKSIFNSFTTTGLVFK